MTDEYFIRFQNLILEFFMFNIHPIVFEPMPEKLDMKNVLRKYLYEYMESSNDRTADVTRRFKATTEMQSKISTYHLTRQLTVNAPMAEQEQAYDACTQKFVAMRSMMTEYATQVDRQMR